MICKDMKYVALYWALRFVEVELDIHRKNYDGYVITIYAEEQRVDYGSKIKSNYSFLYDHKDFVVLECVDRLLTLGYKPEQIELYKDDIDVSVILSNGKHLAIYCEQWGDDYYALLEKNRNYINDYNVLYTSRLVSGLLEFKNLIITDDKYSHGVFDSNKKFDFILSKELSPNIEHNSDYDDFDIYEDEVIRYKGEKEIVHIPEGVKSIAASAFWNNDYIKQVIFPDSLKILGGDLFYCCNNLEKVTITKNISLMGNNPFAGCPKLKLNNESPFYILEDGVLYDRNKQILIYYPIKKTNKSFDIPCGVRCISKHSFFKCDNLENLDIPVSVMKMENNPFSGCEHLNIVNHSAAYNVIDGIIYNKYMTTIIGCLNGTKKKEFTIPSTVTLISRNSFWNCNGLEKINITKNVKIIGYNPFANCHNLLISGESDNFNIEGGIIYNKSYTNLICTTDKAVGEHFKIRDEVEYINRGAFSGCISLKQIDLNNVRYIDKSAFTNCINLKEVYIPDRVKYVGEWVFAHCINLKKISIKKGTFIDVNAFNECPVVIEWRE